MYFFSLFKIEMFNFFECLRLKYFLLIAMSKDYLLPPGQSSDSKLRLKSTLCNIPCSFTVPCRRTSSTESTENTGFDEDREFRQLIDTVPVVPKLPKMPDISKYLNKGKRVNRSKRVGDRSSIIKDYMYAKLFNN